MQAGGDPGDPHAGRVAVQGRDEPVAPAPVGEPRAADVAVVGAALDERGERQLVEHAALAVGRRLRGHHVVDEVRGKDEPPETHAGCQRLARGPGVDDVLGRERLHGAHRLAVVAELAVVVVLDHDAAGALGPGDGGGAPLRGEQHAERELVGGRQQRRVGVAQLLDRGAERVHGQRADVQPRGGDDLAVCPVAVRLDGHRPGAAGAQRAGTAAPAPG